jgi:hypothetical protein
MEDLERANLSLRRRRGRYHYHYLGDASHLNF